MVDHPVLGAWNSTTVWAFDARGNCEVCHTDQRVMANGTVPPKKTPAELLDFVSKIKNATRLAVNQIQLRSTSNKNHRRKDRATIE